SGRMSAFPHIPRHFVNWLETQPETAQFCQPGQTLTDAVMPRRVYGQYVNFILHRTLDKIPAGSKLEFLSDQALNLTELPGTRFEIELKAGRKFRTDKVVLALGNFAPEPLALSPEMLESESYYGNPWKPESLKNLQPDEPILLVGTGLTMIDVVLSLLEQHFTGKIIAVSP